jgi:hypothetical protein
VRCVRARTTLASDRENRGNLLGVCVCTTAKASTRTQKEKEKENEREEPVASSSAPSSVEQLLLMLKGSAAGAGDNVMNEMVAIRTLEMLPVGSKAYALQQQHVEVRPRVICLAPTVSVLCKHSATCVCRAMCSTCSSFAVR